MKTGYPNLLIILTALTMLFTQLSGTAWSAGEDAPATEPAGADESQWRTIDDLPGLVRQRVDALYAGIGRKFTALDGKVEKYFVDQLTVPEAVAKLSRDYDVLCGIELIPWPAGSRRAKGLSAAECFIVPAGHDPATDSRQPDLTR